MDDFMYREFAEIEARHWWFEGRRRILRSILASYLRSDPDRRILDAGCGTGGMFPMLAEFGRPVGVDFHPAAVESCRSLFWTAELAEAGKSLPFPDRSFDAVTAFDMLEHVVGEAAFLAEIRRVLRPEGVLFVTVPAFPFLWSVHDEVNRHARRYRRPGLVSGLRAAGFAVDRATYFNALLFPAVAAFRLASRLFPPGERRSDFRLPPGPVNLALAALFGLERIWLKRRDFPFGVSLLAVARRR